MDANTELAKLEQQRGRAAARISDVEREWGEAAQAARDASARLAELERHGGSASNRHAAEEKLAKAKAKADEPWAERLAGAQAAARDVDHRRREHVAAHLAELVETLEADGRVAAEAVNTATAALISAYAQWHGAASQISALITLVANPAVNDVSRSRTEADEAARAAANLVRVGGEQGPMLNRNNPPWHTLLAAVAKPVKVTA